jgi:hypothetical protein
MTIDVARFCLKITSSSDYSYLTNVRDLRLYQCVEIFAVRPEVFRHATKRWSPLGLNIIHFPDESALLDYWLHYHISCFGPSRGSCPRSCNASATTRMH